MPATDLDRGGRLLHRRAGLRDERLARLVMFGGQPLDRRRHLVRRRERLFGRRQDRFGQAGGFFERAGHALELGRRLVERAQLLRAPSHTSSALRAMSCADAVTCSRLAKHRARVEVRTRRR